MTVKEVVRVPFGDLSVLAQGGMVAVALPAKYRSAEYSGLSWRFEGSVLRLSLGLPDGDIRAFSVEVPAEHQVVFSAARDLMVCDEFELGDAQ